MVMVLSHGQVKGWYGVATHCGFLSLKNINPLKVNNILLVEEGIHSQDFFWAGLGKAFFL